MEGMSKKAQEGVDFIIFWMDIFYDPTAQLQKVPPPLRRLCGVLNILITRKDLDVKSPMADPEYPHHVRELPPWLNSYQVYITIHNFR